MSKDFGIHVETPKETIERLNEGWNRCREELMQIIRERDELAARVKVLEDALREILDEIGDQNYHEVYAIGRYALEGK